MRERASRSRHGRDLELEEIVGERVELPHLETERVGKGIDDETTSAPSTYASQYISAPPEPSRMPNPLRSTHAR